MHLHPNTQGSRSDCLALRAYDSRLERHRTHFESSRTLQAVLDEQVPRERLVLFLLHYRAFGAAMLDGGTHEVSRRELLLDDVRRLAAPWIADGGPAIDVERLCQPPWSGGVRRYLDLNEPARAGRTRHQEVAVAHELEVMNARHRPRLLQRACGRLGGGFVTELYFLGRHWDLDHDDGFPARRSLARLLDADPGQLDAQVVAGLAALAAYAAVLDDCLAASDRLLRG